MLNDSVREHLKGPIRLQAMHFLVIVATKLTQKFLPILRLNLSGHFQENEPSQANATHTLNASLKNVLNINKGATTLMKNFNNKYYASK